MIAEMRRVIDEFDNRVLIGEIYLPLERLVAYYGNDLAGAQLPFNFALLSTCGARARSRSSSHDYEEGAAGRRLAELGARQPRPAAGGEPGRAGAGARRRDVVADACGARRRSIMATRSACARSPIAPDQVRDPFEKNVPGIGVGRDGCRTPMQWDASAHARLFDRKTVAAAGA